MSLRGTKQSHGCKAACNSKALQWRYLRPALFAHTAQALGSRLVSAAIANANLSEP